MKKFRSTTIYELAKFLKGTQSRFLLHGWVGQAQVNLMQKTEGIKTEENSKNKKKVFFSVANLKSWTEINFNKASFLFMIEF